MIKIIGDTYEELAILQSAIDAGILNISGLAFDATYKLSSGNLILTDKYGNIIGEKSKDCRDCKEYDGCPCGKDGHKSKTSQGYSTGECKDFEPQESEECLSVIFPECRYCTHRTLRCMPDDHACEKCVRYDAMALPSGYQQKEE